MIVQCSYCNRCLNEAEYKILDRKVRTPTKRRPIAVHKYTASDSDIEELRTMRAGEKHLWLKNHRDEVLDYLTHNGDAETRRHFGINHLDILPEIENWNIPYRETIKKTAILETRIRYLEDEIKELNSKTPQAIAKLSPEEQVKLLTFQLSEAVSRLQIKKHSEKQLRIDEMYRLNTDGTVTPQFALKKGFDISANPRGE